METSGLDSYGRSICAKAEKKLKAWWTSKEIRLEDAGQLFEKAGHAYKLAKEWESSGDSFKRAADCARERKDLYEAVTQLVNAAHCYGKLTNNSQTIDCFKQAADLNLENGRYIPAAKLLVEIAHIYEKDFEPQKAQNFYLQASEIFENENDISQMNNCLLKLAEFYGMKTVGKYKEAIDIYLKLVKRSIDNNSLKWRTKEFLLRAGLCWLGRGDLVGTSRAIQEFNDLDACFSSTREGMFLNAILEHVESNDLESFTMAVVEYDSITRLDTIKTDLLLVIKNSIPGSSISPNKEDCPEVEEEDNKLETNEKVVENELC